MNRIKIGERILKFSYTNEKIDERAITKLFAEMFIERYFDKEKCEWNIPKKED